MSSLTLNVKTRDIIGKQVDKLRRDRTIPAVIYGHNIPSRPVSVEAGPFEAIFKQAGSTSLVDVAVGETAPVKALIHAIQRHPTTNRITHVDLYQVKMTEKLEADIELNFVGESAAVKEQGGIFIRTLDKLKVSCLPADLVPSIDVDISQLKTFEDRIHVSDLKVPSGMTVLDKGEEVVASVTAPRTEAELASLSEKVEEDVESVESSKKAKPTEEVEEGVTDEKAPATDQKPEAKKTDDKKSDKK